MRDREYETRLLFERVMSHPFYKDAIRGKLSEYNSRIDLDMPLKQKEDNGRCLNLPESDFIIVKIGTTHMPIFPAIPDYAPYDLLPPVITSLIVQRVKKYLAIVQQKVRVKDIEAVYTISAGKNDAGNITGTLEISPPHAVDSTVEIIHHVPAPDSKVEKIIEIVNALHENPRYLDHVYNEYKVKWKRFLKCFTAPLSR